MQVEAIQTIAEETQAEGNVSSHIYFTYFMAGCSLLVLMVIVFLSILAEVSHRPLMVPLASEWRFSMFLFIVNIRNKTKLNLFFIVCFVFNRWHISFRTGGWYTGENSTHF